MRVRAARDDLEPRTAIEGVAAKVRRSVCGFSFRARPARWPTRSRTIFRYWAYRCPVAGDKEGQVGAHKPFAFVCGPTLDLHPQFRRDRHRAKPASDFELRTFIVFA